MNRQNKPTPCSSCSNRLTCVTLRNWSYSTSLVAEPAEAERARSRLSRTSLSFSFLFSSIQFFYKQVAIFQWIRNTYCYGCSLFLFVFFGSGLIFIALHALNVVLVAHMPTFVVQNVHPGSCSTFNKFRLQQLWQPENKIMKILVKYFRPLKAQCIYI